MTLCLNRIDASVMSFIEPSAQIMLKKHPNLKQENIRLVLDIAWDSPFSGPRKLKRECALPKMKRLFEALEFGLGKQPVQLSFYLHVI